MQAKIKLEQELVTYIQTLYYEINMNEEVLQKIISDAAIQNTTGIVKSQAFKEYQEETMKAKIKYDEALEEVKEKILGPLAEHECNFSIDFRTCIMTVNINCECGEKIYKEQIKKEWDQYAKNQNK